MPVTLFRINLATQTAREWLLSFDSSNLENTYRVQPVTLESADNGRIYMVFEDTGNSDGTSYLVWTSGSFSVDSLSFMGDPGGEMKLETTEYSVTSATFYSNSVGSSTSLELLYAL